MTPDGACFFPGGLVLRLIIDTWLKIAELVGGIPTPLKILFSWDDDSQYGKIKNVYSIKMFQTTNQ